ncbi:hypothetical protein QVD17_03408 [Tagetes erecta]|uniref:Uncharacterized protein n=1 Tax=Tagetes erecta TaxID=13708 RepID=A0AAD8P9Q7_TARER|nr:hypothetical protein QVD17_03408 [Tagetes erecta]
MASQQQQMRRSDKYNYAADDEHPEVVTTYFESHTLMQPNTQHIQNQNSQSQTKPKPKDLEISKALMETAEYAASEGVRNVVKETALAADYTRDSMEGLNAGVGGVVEGLSSATEKTFATVVGASYVGEKVVTGSLETGKATAGYVAGVAKELATGVTESMEGLNAGVAALVEGTALATEKLGHKTVDRVVDVGKKGAVEGKDVTSEYVGKAAGVVKDAALVGGWSAAELASDTATGVKESMEGLNAGVAGLVEGTALAFGTMGTYIGEKSKDITLETGKASSEYVGRAVKDAALVGGLVAKGLKDTAGVGGTADHVKKLGDRDTSGGGGDVGMGTSIDQPNKINVQVEKEEITSVVEDYGGRTRS